MLPLAIGAASLATAAFAGYHSLAWRSQLYGRTFFGTPGHGRKLALTYDDGPNDPETPLLLDILAKHNVKATFFLIGKYVQQRPDIVRRIAAEGHEIGNHTFSHPNLAFSFELPFFRNLLQCEWALFTAGIQSGIIDLEIDWELEKNRTNAEEKLAMHLNTSLSRNATTLRNASSKIRAMTGTRLFRPPFGARRPSTLRIARELGYTPIMWSVTCFDWKSTTTDRVERHAIRQITGGDIILMHDGGHKHLGTDRQHTVEATDRILNRYKSEGFDFVTVPEMMEGLSS